MFDVLLHSDPLPENLRTRPKKYFVAQGDEAPRGLVRMTEKELRTAIDDTEEAFDDFLNRQAFEAPALPALYLRSIEGVTYRLWVDSEGSLKADPLFFDDDDSHAIDAVDGDEPDDDDGAERQRQRQRTSEAVG